MAYRIIKYSATGVIPFLLIYSREAILPIDKTKPLMIYKHMMNIVEEIPHIREEARLMIQKTQDHMMQILEKERRFIVDKEILCHDSTKESWYSEKLKLK